MPDKSGRLNPMEQVFIERFAATDDKVYAATAAGYADPAQSARALLKRPAVANAAAEKRRAALEEMTEMLPLAVAVVREALTNDRLAIQHRLKAAKMTMDSVKEAADPLDAKELHEMTADEIGRLLGAVEARLVDVTPKPLEPVNLGVLG